jgi:hypothetical protein
MTTIKESLNERLSPLTRWLPVHFNFSFTSWLKMTVATFYYFYKINSHCTVIFISSNIKKRIKQNMTTVFTITF